MVSPLCSPPHENTPNGAGLTLVRMRALISDAVASLQRHGHKHLMYQDGTDIFGPEHLGSVLIRRLVR